MGIWIFKKNEENALIGGAEIVNSTVSFKHEYNPAAQGGIHEQRAAQDL